MLIPQVASAVSLDGRESKVVVTDYAWGSSRALYSTAEVFFAGKIGSRDVLFLFGNSDQQHEASLKLSGTPSKALKSTSQVSVKASTNGETIVTFLQGLEGLITIWDSNTQLVLFADTVTTASFFSPIIPGTSNEKLAHYWQFGSNSTILVGGPYLVRNATVSGSTLALQGDLNSTTRLTVVAPPTVRSITWNGQNVALQSTAGKDVTASGGFVGDLSLSSSAGSFEAPQLANWKFANSLPEIEANFSDASWAVANHSSTNIPFPPYYGDGRILYGCDYGL
jgi:hypothetical protein